MKNKKGSKDSFRLITGTLLGGILGGFLAWRTNVNIKKETIEKEDLGYDWPYILNVDSFHDAFLHMKQFKHASEEDYKEFGTNCNKVLEIYILCKSNDIIPEPHWSYDCFKYRRDAESAGLRLWNKLKNCEPVSTLREEEEGIIPEKSTDVKKCKIYCEEIFGMLQGIYWETRNTITNKIESSNKKMSKTKEEKPIE